jgi:histone H3/H4
MRIAGAVKANLVTLVCEELDRLVPLMEAATLDNDAERKTLDDAQRTRLNYNRTRELMIDRIENVESVGSAAVQGGIEHLEKFLARLMRHSEEAASRDRVSTIKPRHLEIALHSMGKGASSDDEEEEQHEEGVEVRGGIITMTHVKSMSRTHAKMAITDDAAEDLLLTYGDMVSELENDIRQHANLGRDPMYFIDSVNRLSALMAFGWIRRMLMKAADNARERGYSRIDIEQIVHIDPFE